MLFSYKYWNVHSRVSKTIIVLKINLSKTIVTLRTRCIYYTIYYSNTVFVILCKVLFMIWINILFLPWKHNLSLYVFIMFSSMSRWIGSHSIIFYFIFLCQETCFFFYLGMNCNFRPTFISRTFSGTRQSSAGLNVRHFVETFKLFFSSSTINKTLLSCTRVLLISIPPFSLINGGYVSNLYVNNHPYRCPFLLPLVLLDTPKALLQRRIMIIINLTVFLKTDPTNIDTLLGVFFFFYFELTRERLTFWRLTHLRNYIRNSKQQKTIFR